MVVRFEQAKLRKTCSSAAFTLVEVLISVLIIGLVMVGMVYGYVQANRMAEWSSMSLAAQSYASQGMEQMRSAQWNSQQWPETNGPGTSDELPLTLSGGVYSFSTNEVDVLDVPTTGTPISITNFITVTQVSTNPSLRQIVSQCVWTFPYTKRVCTNTMITLRAPDQ